MKVLNQNSENLITLFNFFSSFNLLEKNKSVPVLFQGWRFLPMMALSLLTLYGCNSSWHSLGGGSPEEIETTFVYDEDLIAGGGSYIGRWDGSQWQSMGSLNHISALVEYNNELLAGGSFGLSKWTGNGWTPISTDGHHEALAIYDGKLIAGGWSLIIDGIEVNRIAAWDGSKWHALGSGMDGRIGRTVNIQALTVFNGELIAGGNFTRAGGVRAEYIARWDGAQWHPLSSGMGLNNGLNGIVHSLVVYKNELIAGGRFETVDGLYVNYIARWDGSQWRQVGTKGMDGKVLSLTVYDGDLIAGGEFTTSDGVVTNCIARWNGSEWRTMGEGMSTGGRQTKVMTLSEFNGELVAGGYFLYAGGKQVNNIARWGYGD